MYLFGINYCTKAVFDNFAGDASVPAQPVWVNDEKKFYIVDGTVGKYQVAMKAELDSVASAINLKLANYLTKVDASATYLTKATATQTYATKAELTNHANDASKVYLKSAELEQILIDVTNEGAKLTVG